MESNQKSVHNEGGDNVLSAEKNTVIENSKELRRNLATCNAVSGGAGVMIEQDISLFRRPLMKSPFDSDGSKEEDLIGESMHGEVLDDMMVDRDSSSSKVQTFGKTQQKSFLSNDGKVVDPIRSSRNDKINIEASHLATKNEPPRSHEVIETNLDCMKHLDLDRRNKRDRLVDAYPTQLNSALEEHPTKKSRDQSDVGTTLKLKTKVEIQSPRYSGVPNTLRDGPGVKNKLIDVSASMGVLRRQLADDRLAGSFHLRSEPLSSNLNPDVFEDAEDDETFDLVLKKKMPYESQSSLPPDVVSAILGSPLREKIAPGPVSAPVSTIAALSVMPVNGKTPKSRIAQRPPSTKSFKKVWVAKKEQDAAITALRGKVDLLRVLPKRDSDFLGKECYIFALHQLEHVLSERDGVSEAEFQGKSRQFLLDKIIKSDLFGEESSQPNAMEQSSPSDGGTEKDLKRVESTNRGSKASMKLSEEPLVADSGAQTALQEKQADALLGRWEQAIKEWKQRSLLSEESRCQFPLDGPLSRLIPTGTRQFFQSINLQSALEFLSLKKTETGLVVQMFHAWRSKCGLRGKPSLALAKHLLGVNARVEMAIHSPSGIDPSDLRWINGAMVVVSGAAKDFIVDECKIHSAEQFVEMKTKLLADKLSEWRTRMGLPILKGSGKVAMISAWKSLLKDEVEIQNSIGKVMDKEDLTHGTDNESQLEKKAKKHKIGGTEESSKRKVPKVASPKYVSRKAQEALQSESFFVEVFGDDERNMAMFRSVGITTAHALLDADKGQSSDFLKAVIALKSAQNGGSVQYSSCIRLLYSWAAKVKGRLDDIEQGRARENSRPVVRKDSPPVTKLPQRERKSLSHDPFDALSASNKEFLATMNITTAAQFLSAGTTRVANAFIRWRQERNLSTLKGLGAVASVSGWKKLVRNKAFLQGDKELAQLNRASNSKAPLHVEATDKHTPRKSQCFLQGDVSNTESILAVDASVEKVQVVGLSNTAHISFHFELDVRSGPINQEKIYLTYIGSDSHTKKQGFHALSPSTQDELVMVDVTSQGGTANGRIPYDSNTFGMLDLGSYRFPVDFKATDRITLLMNVIKSFLDSTNASTKNDRSESSLSFRMNNRSTPGSYNVFKAERSGKICQLVHLSKPFEKGQSVELRLLPTCIPNFTEISDLRRWIEQRIAELSSSELNRLLNSLEEENRERTAQKLTMAANGRVDQTMIIHRRRLHWVATRIDAHWRDSSHDDNRTAFTPPAIEDILWSKSVVDEYRSFSNWKSDLVRQEILDEMNHAFELCRMENFVESRDSWCPVALRLFSSAMDVFAGFLAELSDSCKEKEMTSRLCEMTSQAVADIKHIVDHREVQGSKDFSDVTLTYPKAGRKGYCGILPSASEVFRQVYSEPYEDALLLCDEPCFKLDSTQDLKVVAVQGRTGSIAWRLAEDAQSGSDAISIHWYLERQVAAVIQVVVNCGIHMLAPYAERLAFHSLDAIEKKVNESIRVSPEDPPADTILVFNQNDKVALEIIPQEVLRANIEYLPNSSPFFHGFIWPVLRGFDWRLIAGETPSDLIYCLPSPSGPRSCAGRFKQKIARQRIALARDANSVGLGYVRKLTKRLLIECSHDCGGDDSSEPDRLSCFRSNEVRAGQIIQDFGASLLENISCHTNDAIELVENVVQAISSLFNKCAPHLLFGTEEIKRAKDERWSDILGPRHLLRMLLALPSVLRETDLAPEQDHVVSVARELIEFVSCNYIQFFGNCFHLPTQEYEEEPAFLSMLSKDIEKALYPAMEDTGSQQCPRMDTEEENSIEIFQERDRHGLTDFFATVMKQTIIAHATEEDVTRKNGRVSLGHPCIVCRHCHGRHGEGKYFFGSIESITTAATVIEKHLLRCPDNSQRNKEDLKKARMKHPDQRKMLPSGAQGAFFARLYDRLQALRPAVGTEANIFISSSGSYVVRADTSGSAGRSTLGDSDEETGGFKSHIEVMEYIQATEPWKSKELLNEAVEKYYNCLEYGGKIVNTKKAPTNFSSEWLRAKIAP